MAKSRPTPQPSKPDAGKFGQQKGNIKPTSGKPVGGPPPKPAAPKK